MLLLLSIVPVCAFSQSWQANQPIIEQGSGFNQSVTNIVKDKEGFLWISSRSGIARYDGRNLRKYPLSSSSMVLDEDGRQVYIRQTDDKRLWAFTDSGKIYEYDAILDTFVLRIDTRKTSLTTFVNDIYIDKARRLWVATSTGLLCYGLGKDSLRSTLYKKGTYLNFISPLADSALLIGTSAGLEIASLAKPEKRLALLGAGMNMKSIYHDQQSGLLWMGSFSSGVLVYDLAAGKYLDYPFLQHLPAAPVKVIRALDSTQLIMGLDGRGVYKVDPQRKTVDAWLTDDGDQQLGLKGNGVYDLLVDGENTWVGTYSGGLSLIRGNKALQWVRHEPYNDQSVRNNEVYAMLEDRDGDLWYATNSGVSCYQVKRAQWKHYLTHINTFLTLTEDWEGYIWCGGYGTGLQRIDKRDGTVSLMGAGLNHGQLESIYASMLDADGDLWFGSLYASLTKMHPRKGYLTRKEYQIGQVRSILPLGRDTLFLATSNGFYLLDKASGQYKRYFGDPAGYGVKSNSFIYSALRMGDDVWFGTDGGGLNVFNLLTGKVQNFSAQDGLPSNYIYGILADSQQQLWISSSDGLFCFDPNARKLLFAASDLPVKKFLFMSFTQLRDGRMAFGGTNGAIFFQPDSLKSRYLQPLAKPAIHLTDFKLFYQRIDAGIKPNVLQESIDRTQQMTVAHDQNTFSFGYVAVNLYNPDQYTYAVKLDGFDGQWVEKGNQLTVDYSNIPPGDYRFSVRCKARDGGRVLAERSMQIRVRQPIWNTGWAWIGYVLVSALLLYWAWKSYWDRAKQRQSTEKIAFFVNMAHDIRTPLSLILAPLQELEAESLSTNGQKLASLARQNGLKLQGLVSQLLDFQKEEVFPARLQWTVVELSAYLNEKLSQFRPLAMKKGLTIALVDPTPAVYLETDLRKLDRILDNLLSNAIKYTLRGDIQVSYGLTAAKLNISVTDPGIGISKKAQAKIFQQFYRAENAVNSNETGTGIGLMFSRRLARLLKGDLTFSSEEGKGSSFCLTLPRQEGQVPSPVIEQPQISQAALAAKYRILIVEDNDEMRDYLAGSLSKEFSLHAVSSAEEALAFLKKEAVDLVLTDLMMPGIHGDELCRRIKSSLETSHIHVMLLTALDDQQAMINSLEFGADSYLTKPFDMQALKLSIQNFLLSRKKLQQHFQQLFYNESEGVAPGAVAGPQQKAAQIDEQFLAKCIQVVHAHMADPGFSIVQLCREMAMSRTLLYEKLKALINQSPSDFIREIRLKKAKQLLLSQKYSIQEVASLTGFADSKYFSTLFKRHFGTSPSGIAAK